MTLSSTLSSVPRENYTHRLISTSRTLVLAMVSPLVRHGGQTVTDNRISARRILDRYRPEFACFNDDVQGTGCVTLAAIMAGLHVSGQKLPDIRMVVFGAGSAGVGIADQVRDAIAAEGGISHDEAAKQIW